MVKLNCSKKEIEFDVSNIALMFSPYAQEELVVDIRVEKHYVFARLLRIEPIDITDEGIKKAENCRYYEENIEEIKGKGLSEDKITILSEVEMNIKEDTDSMMQLKIIKQTCKRASYKLLSEYLNKIMPWGILTGIRPTKIVNELFNQNLTMQEVNNHLRDEYLVSDSKRKLMVKVAREERHILSQNKKDEISIYIGIPFCPTRCVYCSFTAYSLDKCGNAVEEYLKALFKEITYVAEVKKDAPIRSLYIGGGTPTSLNEDQLERLLKHINNSFDMQKVSEYTVEAGRPDTITREKLIIMKKQGVGRISINPQSMNQKTLDIIGRKHSVEDIKKVFYEARQEGHDCINMDIILGLPGEDVGDVENTLIELEKLKPENITVHTMAIKRASLLKEDLMWDEEASMLVQGQKIEKMLGVCEKHIGHMGLEPYYMYRQKNMLGNFENVGYSTKDTPCVYNVEIMEEKEPIIALGAGGVTKMVYSGGIERIPNVKSLKDYIERIDEMIDRKKVGFEKYR